MVRWLALVALVSSPLWAPSAADGKGPLSPFEVAQLIESGSRVDWAQLWKDIAAPGNPPEDVPLPHCGDPQYSPCATELIGVQRPAQFILLIHEEPDAAGDFFLRFLKQDDGWKFAGYYFALVRYYPSRHGILRFGDKPFLKVSEQGASGTGVGSEIEEWFDLTLPNFDPVFSFTVQGSSFLAPSDVGRSVQGSAIPDRREGAETIDVSLTLRFSLEGDYLGEVGFTGIYECPPGQDKFVLRRAGIGDYGQQIDSMSIRDFESLTDMEADSGELLLKYDLADLKTIAAGKDAALKEKLTGWLGRFEGRPEVDELKRLLRGGK